MAGREPDNISSPNEVLHKVSAALMLVAKGDPMTALRGELATKFEAIETRFDAIDKATDLVHEDYVRVPTQVDKAVSALRDVISERVDGHFALLRQTIDGSLAVVNEKIKSLSDVTTQQFKSITDTFAEKDKAVSVGLSAQKEAAAAQQAGNAQATTKMEDNFTKLLDQGRELLAEVRRNTEVQISDIKDRLTAIESRAQGVVIQKQETVQSATQSWAYIVGSIGFVIGFGGLIVAILMLRH